MKRRMRRGIRAAGVCAVLAAGAASARGGGQDQAPTFRTGVEYVEVDAIVTDRSGQFVRGLQKDDFQLLEDGKPQAISSFTLIDVPIDRYDKPLYASAPIEPDVRTNDKPFDGRVYVMVIDDRHTDFGETARAKAAARLFIQQRLGANDLMAVLHTGPSSESSQEFTNDKRLLLAAADKTIGQQLPSATTTRNEQNRRSAGNFADDNHDAERAADAVRTLDALKGVADWFATVRGRRKAILFVSEGIDYDITQVVPGLPDLSGGTFTEPPQYASGVIDATRSVVESAMRSNVSIFGIDPRGVFVSGGDATTPPLPDGAAASMSSGYRGEARLAQDSLRALSDETGGFAVVGRNDLAAAFDRIVADNSSYYVLAYYPPGDKRDGKFHKIEVRVARPGVTVRSRRGYLAAKGKAPQPPPPNDHAPSPAVVDALNSPLPVHGLTMSVSAAPFKGKAPNASVFFVAEFQGRDLALAPNGVFEFSYAAVDPSGKVKAGKNDRITWNLRPENKELIERSGFRLLNRIDLPPGRYQMRLASHDPAGGAVGSVAYDVEVPDFYKEPFSMSGVVVASLSNDSMPTVRQDEEIKAALPAPPVTLRDFPQSDELAVFAEVYDNSGDSPHTVDIATTLTADDGKVVFKTDEERASSEIGGGRGGYGYTARVPLTNVAPGSYVLTVQAQSRLGKMPVVNRQVPIRVVEARQ